MKKMISCLLVFLICSSIFAVPLASSWDGVSVAVKEYFQDNANNPKSIKYVECSYIMKLSNGGWAQRVKYRGENAFGATILDVKMFLIQGDRENATVVSAGSVDEFMSALTQANVSIIASYNADGTLHEKY